MRAVLQRVHQAAVRVENTVVGEIGKGFLVFLGITADDGDRDLEYMLSKTINLRAFEDAQGRMNLGLQDIGGSVLVVSQFTLYGDCRKGRRPSFSAAAQPQLAEYWYTKYIGELSACGLHVQSGAFRKMMDVSLTNDGPVTFLLDSRRVF